MKVHSGSAGRAICFFRRGCRAVPTWLRGASATLQSNSPVFEGSCNSPAFSMMVHQGFCAKADGASRYCSCSRSAADGRAHVSKRSTTSKPIFWDCLVAPKSTRWPASPHEEWEEWFLAVEEFQHQVLVLLSERSWSSGDPAPECGYLNIARNHPESTRSESPGLRIGRCSIPINCVSCWILCWLSRLRFPSPLPPLRPPTRRVAGLVLESCDLEVVPFAPLPVFTC